MGAFAESPVVNALLSCAVGACVARKLTLLSHWSEQVLHNAMQILAKLGDLLHTEHIIAVQGMFKLNLYKPLPRLALASSETESETSSSFSSYPTPQAASARPTDTPCKSALKAFSGPLRSLEGHTKSTITSFASKNQQNYEEREIRRKERNNAASRKSRALRKRRFQQMLLETERLTNSNARLRALVEELNSIMAESKAILFEKFTNPVTPDASMAEQQPMTNLRE